mmetsp:Transcript_85354/g.134237  ORF Transcript_85354/g.134237 Transcript_85354/m.134237 type:complete len:142 (+) Transcript_85354:1-426(+)
MSGDDPKQLDKIAFVLLAMSLGICGADRCFAGQVCLGFAKGLTIGGGLVWAIIDYGVVVANSMKDATKLKTFYDVEFQEDTVFTAGLISRCMFFGQMSLLLCCCWQHRSRFYRHQFQAAEVCSTFTSAPEGGELAMRSTEG